MELNEFYDLGYVDNEGYVKLVDTDIYYSVSDNTPKGDYPDKASGVLFEGSLDDADYDLKDKLEGGVITDIVPMKRANGELYLQVDVDLNYCDDVYEESEDND